MLRLMNEIPNNFYLAVSGGIDSMVALDFFRKGKKTFKVAHFDHGTIFGQKAKNFVTQYCEKHKIPYIVGRLYDQRHPGLSQEEHWRNERHKFFNSLQDTVVTVHHLQDVMEWWIFSSLHGEGKIIPYKNKNVIRPFLLVEKKDIINWAKRKDVPYMDDPSNQDEKYMRSIIRHKILPESLRVNPGLGKVLKKKIIEKYT